MKNYLLVITLLVSSTILLSVVSSAQASAQDVPAPLPPPPDVTQSKPNIVYIVADDMREEDAPYMPNLQRLSGEGISLSQFIIPHSWCCPSRVSVLRGQHNHNHKVWESSTNSDSIWENQGYPNDHLGHWMQDAGYYTGMVGKYINGYDSNPTNEPGWDQHFITRYSGESAYFNWEASDQGTLRSYGSTAADYSTDVYSARAQRFITDNASSDTPFFEYIGVDAPHDPYTPAPRHKGTMPSVIAPRSPNYNEQDISDKPSFIRSLKLMTASEQASVDATYRSRVESLQAVDELLGAVYNRLLESGELDNTYIVFTSDNGYENGDHRIRSGKQRGYEESVNVPFVVRGPGIPAGATSLKGAANVDVAPTFLDIAGGTTPSFVDGRSLMPVLRGEEPTPWRKRIVLEGKANTLRGVREFGEDGSKFKYIEYGTNVDNTELYDLAADPYELTNQFKNSSFAVVKNRLNAAHDAVKNCVGSACKTAEDQ